MGNAYNNLVGKLEAKKSHGIIILQWIFKEQSGRI
jgi:hypothetical protein